MVGLGKLVDAYAYSLGDADIGVFGRDIYTHKTLKYNADHVGFAASVIKVPVMVEAFCQLSEGKISFAEKLEMKEEYHYDPFGRDSVGNSKGSNSYNNTKKEPEITLGSKIKKAFDIIKFKKGKLEQNNGKNQNTITYDYHMAKARTFYGGGNNPYGHGSFNYKPYTHPYYEDFYDYDYLYGHWNLSYGGRYDYKPGTKHSLQDLLENMIVSSGNESTNMIADRIGLDNINKRMLQLGLKDTRMTHLIRGKWDYNEGSNDTTAEDMGILLDAIYSGDFLNRHCRIYMRSLLNHFGSGYGSSISSKLPDGVISSGKIGIIDGHHHDVAVINDRYILCVMVCNYESYTKQNFLNVNVGGVISNLGEHLYNNLNEEKHELSKRI